MWHAAETILGKRGGGHWRLWEEIYPYTRVRRPVCGYNNCFHLVFGVLTSTILNNCMGVPLTLGRFFWGHAGYFFELSRKPV